MKKPIRLIAGLMLATSLFVVSGTTTSQAQSLGQFVGQTLGQVVGRSVEQAVGQSLGLVVAQNVGQCLDNRAISSAISGGRILALSQIAQAAGINPSEILNSRVCRINGQPYYLLDTLDAYGRTQNHILRATDGAPYIAG